MSSVAGVSSGTRFQIFNAGFREPTRSASVMSDMVVMPEMGDEILRCDETSSCFTSDGGVWVLDRLLWEGCSE